VPTVRQPRLRKKAGAPSNQLPVINNKKVMLFTTYKIATGSMFRKMKELSKCDSKLIQFELKSQNRKLNEISLDLRTNSLKIN
jgi:hypothetical protein